jgi:hypothetical protein
MKSSIAMVSRPISERYYVLGVVKIVMVGAENATKNHWLELRRRHLPTKYRSACNQQQKLLSESRHQFENPKSTIGQSAIF